MYLLKQSLFLPRQQLSHWVKATIPRSTIAYNVETCERELCITLLHSSTWLLQYILLSIVMILSPLSILSHRGIQWGINSFLGHVSYRYAHSYLFSPLALPVLHSLPLPLPLTLSPSLSPSVSRFYCYRLMFMICITQSTWLMFALVVAAFAAALAAASLCLQVVVVVLAYVYWQLWQSFSAVAPALPLASAASLSAMRNVCNDAKLMANLFFCQISDKLLAQTEMKLSCQRGMAVDGGVGRVECVLLFQGIWQEIGLRHLRQLIQLAAGNKQKDYLSHVHFSSLATYT